jgi:hypothetical protein
MWGLPDRGLEPHPFYDLQCGAADVDGLAADAKLSRASTSTGRLTSPPQPVGQRRPGDARTADQDGQRSLHAVKAAAACGSPSN